MILGGLLRQMEEGQSLQSSDLQKLRGLVKDAARQTRQISHGLNPDTVEGGGLPKALQDLTDLTEQRSEAECRYEGPEKRPANVSEEVLTHLYRIAQEAVNNAAKHGEGEYIWIHLSISGEEIVLYVEDDGTGLSEDGETETGIGIQTMRYRTNLISGTMTIAGPSGGRTQLLVHAPIRTLA